MTRIHEATASKRVYEESAAAATPASGLVHVYAKTDGLLYAKDDAGLETLLSVGGGAVSARASRTNDQSATSAVTLAYNFAAVESDTDVFWAIGNPERFTVATGLDGTFAITAEILWDANGTGERKCYIRKGGSVVAEESHSSVSGSFWHRIGASTIIDLVATDYVDTAGYQNSGGALNMKGARLTIARVGRA